MSSRYMNDDIIQAAAELARRGGAAEFQLGRARDGVPIEDAGWYAIAVYQGARIMVDEQRTPTAAALALAERLLDRAKCKCGKTVTLSDKVAGCRWHLVGNRWTPGCDAPPIKVVGHVGDAAAMQRAFDERHPPRPRRRRWFR